MLKLKLIALLLIPALSVVSVGSRGMAQDAPVLLTVDVNDAQSGETTVYQYTHEDLLAFPARVFSTKTNWTSGTPEFTGVALSDLLEAWNVSDGTMELVAINDYSVRFDADDPTNSGAVVAYFMNGEKMTPRDKGPLWLLYDYDGNADYRTETIFSRSIWQLDRIVISR